MGLAFCCGPILQRSCRDTMKPIKHGFYRLWLLSRAPRPKSHNRHNKLIVRQIVYARHVLSLEQTGNSANEKFHTLFVDSVKDHMQ